MHKRSFLPILVAIIGNVIFGFSFLFTKKALNIDGVTPAILLAYRFFVAFLAMNMALIFSRKGSFLKRKNLKVLVLLGLLQPVAYFLLEDYGLLHSTTTFGSVMVALIPAVTIILGIVFMKELPSIKQILFCILSLGGVIILAMKQSKGGVLDILGVILMIGAVFAGSAFYMLSRQCSKDFTAFERTYVMFAVGSAVFAAIALVQNKGSLSALISPCMSADFIESVIYLGLFSSVIAFMALNYATTYLPLSSSTAFTDITTVVSTVAGMAILHEPCNLLTIIAIILIIIGVIGIQKPTIGEKTKL